MRTETLIFHHHVQLKVLFHQPMALEDRYLPSLCLVQRLERFQLTEVMEHHQMITQRHSLVDQLTQKAVQILGLQANQLMIFTTFKTNIQRLIQQTIETLNQLVIHLTMLLLPDPLKQTARRQTTSHQTVTHKPITHNHLMKLNLIDLPFIIPTLLALTHFPAIFHTYIHTIITISIMTIQMTKIHIFQAFMHTTHHHCTTDITQVHHKHHTQIIMDREVCTLQEDIQTLMYKLDNLVMAEAIVKMDIKLLTIRQIFP